MTKTVTHRLTLPTPRWRVQKFTAVWADKPEDVPEWDSSRGYKGAWATLDAAAWEREKIRSNFEPIPPPEADHQFPPYHYPRLVWRPKPEGWWYYDWAEQESTTPEEAAPGRRKQDRWQPKWIQMVQRLRRLLEDDDSHTSTGKFAQEVLRLANQVSPFVGFREGKPFGLTLRDWAHEVVSIDAALQLAHKLKKTQTQDLPDDDERYSPETILKWLRLKHQVSLLELTKGNQKDLKALIRTAPWEKLTAPNEPQRAPLMLEVWPPCLWWEFKPLIAASATAKDALNGLVAYLVRPEDTIMTLEHLPDKGPTLVSIGGLGNFARYNLMEIIYHNKPVSQCTNCQEYIVRRSAKAGKAGTVFCGNTCVQAYRRARNK